MEIKKCPVCGDPDDAVHQSNSGFNKEHQAWVKRQRIKENGEPKLKRYKDDDCSLLGSGCVARHIPSPDGYHTHEGIEFSLPHKEKVKHAAMNELVSALNKIALEASGLVHKYSEYLLEENETK